jgi:hypothetical protein
MLYTEDCFDSPSFVEFCQSVEFACEKFHENEHVSITYCFDDGIDLEAILELYNKNATIEEATKAMVDHIESGAIDAYLSTPPWDR